MRRRALTNTRAMMMAHRVQIEELTRIPGARHFTSSLSAPFKFFVKSYAILSVFLALLSPTRLVAEDTAPAGTLPWGADGRPLNLDFEDGTLRDWTAEGEAFQGQPIRGEIDQHRKFGRGRHAAFQGEYWIGGYEKLQDKPHGTLTSAPFKVTALWGGFRVGGGRLPGTRVELVRADTKEVFFTARGQNSETMQLVAVDLQSHFGKQIYIHIVDEESRGWGHVNFDDFRFYPTSPVPSATAPDENLAKDGPPAAPAQPGEGFEKALLAHTWTWNAAGAKFNPNLDFTFTPDGVVTSSTGLKLRWKRTGPRTLNLEAPNGRTAQLSFDALFFSFETQGFDGKTRITGAQNRPVTNSAPPP
jgi:hypothetical protein